MEISETYMNQPSMLSVGDIMPPGMRVGDVPVDQDDEKRKQVARDFESIFIHKLLDVMKDTIPESDLEDSSSKQIKSIYWSFLSQAVADGGGLGLSEQIYESMPKPDSSQIQSITGKNVQEYGHRLDESI